MLSDKDKRARYDQFGHAGVDPSYGAGAGAGGFGGMGGFDVGDIFDTFFGGGGGFGGFGGSTRTRNPNAPIRGNDVNINLNLSFMEAAMAVPRRLPSSGWSSVRTAAAPVQPRVPALRPAQTVKEQVRFGYRAGPPLG